LARAVADNYTNTPRPHVKFDGCWSNGKTLKTGPIASRLSSHSTLSELSLIEGITYGFLLTSIVTMAVFCTVSKI